MYEGMKGEYELIKRRGEGTWGSELDYLRVCIAWVALRVFENWLHRHTDQLVLDAARV